MSTTTKTLYDTDFVEWALHMAALVRERRFDELDLENLAEEIESLGRSERTAVQIHLCRMLTDLVRERIQPEEDRQSWRASVVDARIEMRGKLENSPSLKRLLAENLQKTYTMAGRDALEETDLRGRAEELDIPEECPYALDQLLDGGLNALEPPRL